MTSRTREMSNGKAARLMSARAEEIAMDGTGWKWPAQRRTEEGAAGNFA